jgi:uncharacterized SAM-binding protein YcdF (DUF218 family)
MFLFLSKLLPLFFYPLGLACGLIVVALVLLRKRPRIAAGCLITALLVLWLSSSVWGVKLAIGTLERRYAAYADPAVLPQAEAIVVLGGATASAIPPRVRPEVNEAGDRLFEALALYRAGKAPLVVLSGGRIQWNARERAESAEAEDMVRLLRMMSDIPLERFILEPHSLNTYQNAVNVQKILEPRHIHQILLVTSAFHMPRAIAIFRKLGIDAIPAPADFLVENEQRETDSFQRFLLGFLPDAQNLSLTSKGMKEYVGLIVYWLKGWI